MFISTVHCVPTCQINKLDDDSIPTLTPHPCTADQGVWHRGLQTQGCGIGDCRHKGCGIGDCRHKGCGIGDYRHKGCGIGDCRHKGCGIGDYRHTNVFTRQRMKFDRWGTSQQCH